MSDESRAPSLADLGLAGLAPDQVRSLAAFLAQHVAGEDSSTEGAQRMISLSRVTSVPSAAPARSGGTRALSLDERAQEQQQAGVDQGVVQTAALLESRLRDVLADQGIGHTWLDPAEDPAARAMLDELEPPDEVPVVLAPDGRVLIDPDGDELVRLAARRG